MRYSKWSVTQTMPEASAAAHLGVLQHLDWWDLLGVGTGTV